MPSARGVTAPSETSWRVGRIQEAVGIYESRRQVALLACFSTLFCIVTHMAKRTFSTAFDDEELIEIRISDGGPLNADSMLVQMLSQCARALPDKKQWDLRELVIEGQPVSAKIVTKWLNRAYNLIHCCDFDSSEEQTAPSAQDMYLLLAFADAVDTKKSLMEAIAKHKLEAVIFAVDVGQQHIELALNRICSFARS